MAHVCPWWFVCSFDNPIRRLLHDSEQMFGEWVRPCLSSSPRSMWEETRSKPAREPHGVQNSGKRLDPE